MSHKTLHMVTFILLVVGGLNWLLVGLLEWNLVAMITSYLGNSGGMVARAIYVAVGLAAIYEFMNHKKDCRLCGPGGGM